MRGVDYWLLAFFVGVPIVGICAVAFHAGRLYERDTTPNLADGLHALEGVYRDGVYFQRTRP